LRERIESDIRATLVVTTAVHLVPPGTLPRSDYKSRLLDFSEATAEALNE
jgi:phenylacetate-CoA ligase